MNEVEILLKDAGIFTKRTILEHSTNYKGAKAGTKFEAQDNKVKDFIVEVSQEVFAEEDVTKNCSLYQLAMILSGKVSLSPCSSFFLLLIINCDLLGIMFRLLIIK